MMQKSCICSAQSKVGKPLVSQQTIHCVMKCCHTVPPVEIKQVDGQGKQAAVCFPVQTSTSMCMKLLSHLHRLMYLHHQRNHLFTLTQHKYAHS